MQHFRFHSMVLVAGLGAQLACSGAGIEPRYPFIPKGGEPLALTIETREPVPGEQLPVVGVSAVAGGVHVEVARPHIGCLLAEATVGRGPGVLTVFAHVSGDPAALCFGGLVWEYSGVITDVEPGRYTVHIYEAVADGGPKRIGTSTVTVQAAGP